MKRKVVDVGAPAYMAQYAGLMVLLLAFFIVLVSLSQVQEGGFKSGIGDIKNAIGFAGGYGIFNFTFLGKTGGYAPNPKDEESGELGFNKLLHQGEGGSGDTDLSVQKPDSFGFVRFRFPYEFPKGSEKLSPEMAAELKRLGIGFGLFDSKVQIRCFSSEYGDSARDREIALSRASQIMKALLNAEVPSSKVSCIGYSGDRYFEVAPELKPDDSSSFFQKPRKESPKQGAYFYVFVKNLDKLAKKAVQDALQQPTPPQIQPPEPAKPAAPQIEAPGAAPTTR